MTVSGWSPVALHSIAILVTPGTTLVVGGVKVILGGTAKKNK